MSLVLYSSSSESDHEDETKIKRIRREASPVQNEKKNERIRIFPHEEGNWAISVFIPVRCSSHLDTLIDELFETMRGDWKKLDDLHISLSRTFPIRYLHIESIRTSLKEEFSSSSFRFTTQIENVKILDNDDRSTSFFVLTLDQTRQFRRLVRIVDQVFEKLRYPTYYKNPCFHLSFAYSTSENREKIVPDECQSILQQFRVQPTSMLINVNEICFKAGNRIYQLTSNV